VELENLLTTEAGVKRIQSDLAAGADGFEVQVEMIKEPSILSQAGQIGVVKSTPTPEPVTSTPTTPEAAEPISEPVTDDSSSNRHIIILLIVLIALVVMGMAFYVCGQLKKQKQPRVKPDFDQAQKNTMPAPSSGAGAASATSQAAATQQAEAAAAEKQAAALQQARSDANAAAEKEADAAAAAMAGQQAHQRLQEARAQELKTTKAVLEDPQTPPGTTQLPPLKNVKRDAGGANDFHRGEVTAGKGPPSKSRASFKPKTDLSM
jgi:hypothetical protein